MRDRKEYEEKLAASPDEWPWQGRIHELRWTSD
jgi:hypothetical protein